MPLSLTESDKQELLRIARKTLQSYLSRKEFPRIEALSKNLHQGSGAFVTLEKEEGAAGRRLRGCIGHLTAEKPLYQTVQEMAIEAATGDPRFPPVTLEELPSLAIEISALSPFRPVRDLSEIQVGRHGLMVARGMNRGLLLPQVATREGWDRETFLSHTCLKAGLEAGCWREGGVEIFVFSAEVFRESESR